MNASRIVVKAVAGLATLALLAGCGQSRLVGETVAPELSPLRDSLQAVVVVSDNWDASTARLQCYARDGVERPWKPVGDRVPVSIGRAGLGWGRGLGTASLPGPQKREGDGKAPAGAFGLPFAFGYAPKGQAQDVKLPYLAVTANVLGVDDVKSKYYNQIVRADEVPAKDWDSTETMLRADGLYEWGVFVAHNTSPAVPGAGSCIFLHIWRGEGKPTAGCTAMSRPQMVRLATWLDPRAKPVLIQLPLDAYHHLASPWGLPALR